MAKRAFAEADIPTPSSIKSKKARTSRCPSEKTTNQVAFMIVSDTHELELLQRGRFRMGTPEKVDVVLHCGDLTENGTLEGYRKALQLLGQISAELKLVIAGNHEISLDKDFYLKEGGDVETHEQAKDIMTGTLAKESGVTYLEEGTHSFILANGTKFSVYASPYTPSDLSESSSGFQYPSSNDRFNTSEATRPTWATSSPTENSIIPPEVDIIMTHGPPKYIQDRTRDGRSAGCEHLRRAVIQAKPLMHCFGHIHSAWGVQRVAWRSGHSKAEMEDIDMAGANEEMVLLRDFVSQGQARKQGFADLGKTYDALEKGRQTLFVNAAIDPDEDGKARNPPWVVRLKLHRQS